MQSTIVITLANNIKMIMNSRWYPHL